MTDTKSPRAAARARVLAEGPVSLDQAALLFRLPNGRHPKPGTLKRWIARGKAGVRLDGARVDGKECTSLAAVWRFRRETGA